MPRDSVLCEEVIQNEAFSEPWRYSIFDRIDAENMQEEEKELEEISKYEFDQPQTIVNTYNSEENLTTPTPRRKLVRMEILDKTTFSDKIMSDKKWNF